MAERTSPGRANPKVKLGPKDADIIWRYDMMDELGVFPHNASNCSVLILDDIIYVCTSNGQDWTHVNIPSPNSHQLHRAGQKDRQTGREDNASIGPRIFHGQWSSPSAARSTASGWCSSAAATAFVTPSTPKPQKGTGGPIVPVLPGPEFKREEDKDADYLKKVWWFELQSARTQSQGGQADQVSRRGRAERDQRHSGVLQEPRLRGGRADPEHGEGWAS